MVREEFPVDGHDIVTIINPDKERVWTIDRTFSKYTEIPLENSPKQTALINKVTDLWRRHPKFKGETHTVEKLNGYLCDKYSMNTNKHILAGMVHPNLTYTTWTARKLKCPIRMQVIGQQTKNEKPAWSVTELKNIKLEKQAPSLFDSPSLGIYSKTDMLGFSGYWYRTQQSKSGWVSYQHWDYSGPYTAIADITSAYRTDAL